MNKRFVILFFLGSSLFLVGCQTTEGNVGKFQSYNYTPVEADWIRNGEPIKFEGKLWFPKDDIESFLDSEVYMVGTYREVQFFIDRMDVRPFNRLYTKFGNHKFRYFEKRN